MLNSLSTEHSNARIWLVRIHEMPKDAVLSHERMF
jgi:hypothetical protein